MKTANEKLAEQKKFTRMALASARARIESDKASVKSLEDQIAQMKIALEAAKHDLALSEQSYKNLEEMCDNLSVE